MMTLTETTHKMFLSLAATGGDDYALTFLKSMMNVRHYEEERAKEYLKHYSEQISILKDNINKSLKL